MKKYKKESLFKEGSNILSTVFGIDIALFCLLVFISGFAPHFRGLSFIFSFLFGSIGYVTVIPAAIYFSICWAFKIKTNKVSGRFFAGTILVFLGIAFIMFDSSFDGAESFTDPFLFTDSLRSAYVGQKGGLVFNGALGGGIVSYLICGFINDLFGSNFVYSAAYIFIVGGLVLTCWKLIKKFSLWIRKEHVKNLKKKAAIQREKEQENKGFDFSELSTELINQGIKNPNNPIQNDSDYDVDTRKSRYESNHPVEINNSIPRDLESPFNTASKGQSGLTVAMFDDFEDETDNTITESNESTIPDEIPAESPYVSLANEENEDSNELEETAEEIISEPTNESIPEPVQNTIEEEVFEESIVDEPVAEEPASIQPKAIPLPPYEMPSIDLLDPPHPVENQEEVEKACLENERKINAKLESLGVGAYVSSHTIGPSVTRYEIKTNENVPISNVQRVINDLSIKLGGMPIRFETLIRGSDASGLEVINPVTTTVYYRECYQALPNGPKYNMYFPFGKSIAGKVLSADLSDFPHMLVSGTTGSGKSVFLHQVILSLLMRNRPEDLKFLLIDPKHIEMGKYREIGHLICPVVNDPFKAKVALEKVSDEMERRYKVLDEAGGLSIREFNEEYAPEKGLAKLPFIVIVIDEFADLVESCHNISELILKIAQKARAAGIHIILATQRPDVSVINGTIKANLQTRVALSMTSSQDSQTILGQGGAEDLNGKGDMLIDCQQINRVGLTRCQGSFLDKAEIKRVTDFIRTQYKVQYYPEFLDLTDHSNDVDVSLPSVQSASDLKELNEENRYQLVKESVLAKDYASVSGIQREFGVGYPKAGKLFDRLVKEGIVAGENDPRNIPRGRFVLVHIDPNPVQPVGSLAETRVIPDGFPQPKIDDDSNE